MRELHSARPSPLALAVIGILFTMQQNASQQAIEDQRAKAERKLERHRNENAALQAYLDQMTNLLLERNLREAEENSEVSTLAQARTLAVLGAISADRKTEVMSFLVNVDLVRGVDGRDPIIELDSADLAGIKLENPSPYVLDPGHGADLSGADLGRADLRKSSLLGVNLADANLSGANLSNADLEGANLNGASLKGADLSGANLHWADLDGANLKGAILIKADLSKAHRITKEQLVQQAGPLEDTIMPEGTKHD